MTLLLTWLWQGLAISSATALLLRSQRRVSAATRHAIWWLALTAVAILPLAYVAAGLRRAAHTMALPVAVTAVPLPEAPAWFGFVVAVAWAAVALAGAIRIAWSVIAVRRLKRASTPLDPARAARLTMWNAARTHGRRAELRLSPAVHGACALGLGRPVILLSPALLQFDDHRLDGIVIHEMAHIARRDDWMQLLQALVAAGCAFHPAVRMIGRRIDIEREAACDDLVLARGTEVREYARSLADVAEVMARPRCRTLAIPGAARSRSVLRHRVRRLLDPLIAREGRAQVPASLACAITMAIAVGVSVRAPLLVEFVDMSVDAPPALRLARLLLPPGPRWFAGTPDPTPHTAAMSHGQSGVPGSATPSRLAEPTEAPGGYAFAPLALIGSSGRHAVSLGPATAGPDTRVQQSNTQSTVRPAAPAPWSSLAHSAADAGQGVGRAGASVGRFFGRAGKAIGGSF